MIRKISVQDVVSKRPSKEKADDGSYMSGKRNSEERDFLIERLNRKRVDGTVSNSRPSAKKPKSSDHHISKKWIWLSVPIVIVLLLMVILQFFSVAVITITPKQTTVPISATLVASIDNVLATSTASSSTLTYQIINLTATYDQIVSATGTVSTKPQKATGQIIVYNKYSTAAQTLVKSTRFQTASGLIYRTTSTVKVPGMTTSGGKTTSGSISVSVVADQTGSKYNIDLTDFTIPGFKTDATRYAKIYGRSKTAMSGGSNGNTFGVAEADRTSAQTQMDNLLKQSLLKQIQAQKTANSIVFDDASKISFQHLPDTAGVDSKHVVLHEQGTISSIIFDKQMLSKVLLSNYLSRVGGSARVTGLENLHFTPTVTTSASTWQAKPFAFTLTGSVNVVGTVDVAKLTQDLKGVSKNNLADVFAKYQTIEKVNTEIKPLWQNSIPNDESKITINVLNAS